MGMYTEFMLNVELKPSTPQSVKDILQYMVYGSDKEPDDIPDHPLFDPDTRWDYMLQGDSFYFTHNRTGYVGPISKNDHMPPGDYWTLQVHCNFKNYYNEIDQFLSFIAPYIPPSSSLEFVGYTQYELDETPTLLYFYNGNFYKILSPGPLD
jgi:hypothetical protein